MKPLLRGVYCGPSLRRFRRDEGGALSGFMITVLPLFLLAIVGLYAVWQVAGVKQALRVGTYQAARFLSAEPAGSGRRDQWERAALAIVGRELAENVSVKTSPPTQADARTRAQFDLTNLRVTINPVPDLNDCDGPDAPLPFRVTASIPVNINLLPGMPVVSGPKVSWDMSETANGEARCPTR